MTAVDQPAAAASAPNSAPDRGAGSGAGPAAGPAARPAPRSRPGRVPKKVKRGIVVVVLLIFSAGFLYPFAWLLAASLKTRGQVFNNSLAPNPIRWQNYADIWHELPLGHWMFTSIVIASLAAVFVAVSSSLVAWGFAHFRFPLRNQLFTLVLATMMLPAAVTMVPTYLIWKHLGALGTWLPLFAGNLFGSAFYIFLQRQFFLGLPRDLFEAARVDGASYWRTFWQIVMPLSRPSFIIVLLFEFQASWNNLQAALIYLNTGSIEDFTAPLGIAYAMTKYSPTNGGHADYQFVMVAALLVTIPMLVLFSFGQRYFIEGVATTGRKG